MTTGPTNTSSTVGSGNAASHLLARNQPDPADDASTASIKSGIQGYPQSGSGLTEASGTPDLNKPLPSTTGGTSAAMTPHQEREADRSGTATVGPTSTDRAWPLAGGSTTAGNVNPTTSGSQPSNFGTRADPLASSGQDGSRTLGSDNTGLGSTMTTDPMQSSSDRGHLGRDAAAGVGAGGAAAAAEHAYRPTRDSANPELQSNQWSSHDHGGHGHQFTADPCATGDSQGGPRFTSGPHAVDTANRFDPHVGNTQGDNANTGLGVGSETQGTDHHYGRDAALGGGAAGAAGAAALGANRDKDTSSIGPAPTTAGPHSSDLLNKADPRVDSDLSKSSIGPSGASTTMDPNPRSREYVPGTDISSSTGRSTNPRDEHMPGAFPEETSNPYASSHIDPRVDSTPRSGVMGTSTTGAEKDHHYGRDGALAGGAGAAGLGAYEAGRHHDKNQPTSATGTPSTTTSMTGPSTTGTTDPTMGGVPTTSRTDKDHHYGRDAGLAGAGGAGLGAYEAEKHHKHDDPTSSSTYPSTTPGMTGTGTTGVPESTRDNTRDHHTGRDAALAGAGAGAYGAHEYSKHDAEKAEEERLKEQEAQHKQMEKDQKAHEKEIAKEQKAHDKAIAKEEKAHEKAMAKEEKKHEKDEGKKGGLLGFLHRNREDKEEKKLEREDDHTGTKTAAGVGAVGAAGAAGYEADKHHDEHERNRLHKDPPAGYGQTSTASTNDPMAGTGRDHHYGRDAGLAGAGGVGAYETDKHLRHGDDTMGANTGYDQSTTGYDQPTSGTTGTTGTGKDHHYGRDAGIAGAGAGGLGAYEAEKHHRKDESTPGASTGGHQIPYRDPPTKGYATQVTGGTGTTALADGDSTQRGPHLTGAGNKLDPA